MWIVSIPVLPTIYCYLSFLSFLHKMLRGGDYSDEMYAFTSSFFTTIAVLLPIIIMILRTMIHDGMREIRIPKTSYAAQIIRYTVVPMNGDEESGRCAAIDY